MTPHVGGSTEEAQKAIGNEVSQHLIACVNLGFSHASVNFPTLDQGMFADSSVHRICNVHRNVPGVMRDVNTLLADFNIEAQTLGMALSLTFQAQTRRLVTSSLTSTERHQTTCARKLPSSAGTSGLASFSRCLIFLRFCSSRVLEP